MSSSVRSKVCDHRWKPVSARISCTAMRIVLPALRTLPSSTWATFSARAISAIVACLLLRSEEHTSELQSRLHLVCRLLLEKKKQTEFTCSHHHIVTTLTDWFYVIYAGYGIVQCPFDISIYSNMIISLDESVENDLTLYVDR